MRNDCCVLRSYYDLVHWFKTKGKNPYRRKLVTRLRVYVTLKQGSYYEIPVYASLLLKPEESLFYRLGKIHLNSFWFKNKYDYLSRSLGSSSLAGHHCWGEFLYQLSICFDIEAWSGLPRAESLLLPYYEEFSRRISKVSASFHRSIPLANLAKQYQFELSNNLVIRFTSNYFRKHFSLGINSATITAYLAYVDATLPS